MLENSRNHVGSVDNGVGHNNRETRLVVANRQQHELRVNSEPREEYSVAPSPLARKRKSRDKKKRGRGQSKRKQQPSKTKSMGLAWALLAFAALWLVNPADFDFIPVAGWLDDLGIGWFAIRNWREAKRQNSSEKPLSHRYGPENECAWNDECENPRRSISRRQSDLMPPEEPGFCGRVWKAITYLFIGGDL